MEINKSTIPLYLQQRQADIGYFVPDAQLVTQEIGDGNLNFVYRVFDAAVPNCSVILKHAPPYVKILGPGYPLNPQRLTYEFRMLEVYHHFAKGAVPMPLYFDEENAVLVIEDLRDYSLLRDELIRGNVNPALSEQLGRFLARVHSETHADGAHANTDFKLHYENFFSNTAMKALTANYVFTLPFTEHETNFYAEGLEPFVSQLKTDKTFLAHASKLKTIFCNEQQGVIHGDLHTGSVMLKDNSAKFIDGEFACYGPVGFDIGLYWANHYLSYFSHISNPRVQSHLKKAIEQAWEGYAAEFSVQKTGILLQIFHDAAGFTGMEILRRIIGAAHVKDIENIADTQRKLRAEISALHFGAALVKQYENIETLTELTALLENATISGDCALSASPS